MNSLPKSVSQPTYQVLVTSISSLSWLTEFRMLIRSVLGRPKPIVASLPGRKILEILRHKVGSKLFKGNFRLFINCSIVPVMYFAQTPSPTQELSILEGNKEKTWYLSRER